MYNTSDIKKGLKIEMDGAPWTVAEFLFVKPGKGVAFTRTKLKNLLTGSVVDRTFKTGEKLEPADVAQKSMQYLYADGESWHFMDLETFEQWPLTEDNVGEQKNWLVEEATCEVLFYKGMPVSIEVDNFVELEIVECEPGVRGNSATGSVKPAILSTGAKVNVPLFVEQGTWIKVDTRTGEYVERVSK